jgi:hypothetical protein
MTDQANLTRALDLRISAGSECGFYVQEAGEIIAAFTSRAELADWLEDRLGLVPGETEREERELAAYRAAHSNVDRFPNVAGGQVVPPERRSRRFFGR